MASHRADVFQGFGRLRNQFLPLVGRRLANVDRDHPAARRGVVGLEPKDRAVVVNEVIFVIKIADQLDRLRPGVFQILIKNPILVVGSL